MKPLTPNQLDLLRFIGAGGALPEWEIKGEGRVSGALAFYARDRVYNSLEKRGLLSDHETITEAGIKYLESVS